MHIAQSRRTRGNGVSALARRALRLGFAERRRDAVTEPRVLLGLRGRAAVSQLRDSFLHE